MPHYEYAAKPLDELQVIAGNGLPSIAVVASVNPRDDGMPVSVTFRTQDGKSHDMPYAQWMRFWLMYLWNHDRGQFQESQLQQSERRVRWERTHPGTLCDGCGCPVHYHPVDKNQGNPLFVLCDGSRKKI